jgi:hypothetical protein
MCFRNQIAFISAYIFLKKASAVLGSHRRTWAHQHYIPCLAARVKSELEATDTQTRLRERSRTELATDEIVCILTYIEKSTKSSSLSSNDAVQMSYNLITARVIF